MDFQVAPVNANGPGDPLNLAARGAEPLLSLPPAHFLRGIGHPLLPTPGALAPLPNNI